MTKPIIAFIGAGAVGTSLAFWLKQANYPLAGIASRSYSSAQKAATFVGVPVLSLENACQSADILFITTPDREISNVVDTLADCHCIRKDMIIAHTSGAHASDLLEPARTCGAHLMSFHPLQSFTKPESKLVNLKNTIFTLEGDEHALVFGIQIVQALKGQPVIIHKTQKPLYHAGACTASNYLVAVLHLAVSLLINAGFSKEAAQSALLPLVHGTLDNIEATSVSKALTGPLSRGDAATVNTHLEAMQQLCPDLLPLYSQLGVYTTYLASENKSITVNQAQMLVQMLSDFKNC